MPRDAIDELLAEPALASANPSSAFLQAADECLRTLLRRFPRYSEFIHVRIGNGLREGVASLEQLDRLPSVFLPVLKSYQFPLPADLIIVKNLTSSGTTGKPSVTPLDESSWQRRVRAMLNAYRALDLLHGDSTALAFLMDPATSSMAGSLVIDAVLRSVPNVREVHYLARMGQAGPEFAIEKAASILYESIHRGSVVLVGYPALIAAAMHGLSRLGKSSLPLPPGSRILTGGGWKSFLPGVSLEQEQFRRQAAAFFAIPRSSIRDMFGLSECPAVFVQCEHDRYHVPAWCWAQAIDPESRREVPDGEVGLLQLTTPLTTSYPLLRILTTDRVAMGHGCACGRPARFVVPRGRVKAARFETCAMKIGQAVA